MKHNIQKECGVIMLPTENKSAIVLGDILVNVGENNVQNDDHVTKQHIYIISNDEEEEIEVGDWVLSSSNIVHKCVAINDEGRLSFQELNFITVLAKSCKKIIATTDNLRVGASGTNLKESIYLPQPSEDFIEKFIESYNNGNPIEKVLVDYSKYINIPTGTKIKFNDNLLSSLRHLEGLECVVTYGLENRQTFGDDCLNVAYKVDDYEIKYFCHVNHFSDSIEDYYYLKPTISYKGNNIYISSIKEEWDREEVIANLKELYHNMVDKYDLEVDYNFINKWIEKKL